MSNRIVFFDSISGIKYPEMLVDFFDQFIALKQLVQDCGTITVDSYTESSISFFISFNDNKNINDAIVAGRALYNQYLLSNKYK